MWLCKLNREEIQFFLNHQKPNISPLYRNTNHRPQFARQTQNRDSKLNGDYALILTFRGYAPIEI